MYMDKTRLFIHKTDFLTKFDVFVKKNRYNMPKRRGVRGVISVRTDSDLQKIFDSAAPGETVILPEGTFRQKCKITTPGLTVVGAGADKTVLIYDDYAKKIDEAGMEYVTFRTWTLAVCADGVTMRDLAVVNVAGHPERKGQEVALTVYGDNFRMENCRLTSTQDTLFSGPLPPDLIDRYEGFLSDDLRRDTPGRQIFENCLIEGTVDFIFGSGAAVFRSCEIRSLPDARKRGYAAAPSHSREQTEGFVFQNCRFTREEGVEDGSVFLARPWRDYGLCSFIGCEIGPHISPLGYDPWEGTRRDETARFYESPLPPGRVPWVKKGSGPS